MKKFLTRKNIFFCGIILFLFGILLLFSRSNFRANDFSEHDIFLQSIKYKYKKILSSKYPLMKKIFDNPNTKINFEIVTYDSIPKEKFPTFEIFIPFDRKKFVLFCRISIIPDTMSYDPVDILNDSTFSAFYINDFFYKKDIKGRITHSYMGIKLDEIDFFSYAEKLNDFDDFETIKKIKHQIISKGFYARTYYRYFDQFQEISNKNSKKVKNELSDLIASSSPSEEYINMIYWDK